MSGRNWFVRNPGIDTNMTQHQGSSTSVSMQEVETLLLRSSPIITQTITTFWFLLFVCFFPLQIRETNTLCSVWYKLLC